MSDERGACKFVAKDEREFAEHYPCDGSCSDPLTAPPKACMDAQTAADVRTLMDRVIGHPPVPDEELRAAFARLMVVLP